MTNQIPEEDRKKGISAELKQQASEYAGSTYTKKHQPKLYDARYFAFLAGATSSLTIDNLTLGLQSAEKRVKELEDGLKKAVTIIKDWHQADDVWDIYFNNAPEMKPIKHLLSK